MSGKMMSCLDGQVHMELPEGWGRLPEELAAVRFPYRNKPQEIYAAPEADRLLTLNLLEKPLQERQVKPAIWEMQRLISHLYPESVREMARILRVGAGTAGYFLFVTGGIDHDTGHAMFILPVRERMLLGGFHFPMERRGEGRAVFLEILKGIQTGRDAEEVVTGNHG